MHPKEAHPPPRHHAGQAMVRQRVAERHSRHGVRLRGAEELREDQEAVAGEQGVRPHTYGHTGFTLNSIIYEWESRHRQADMLAVGKT